MQHLLNLLFLLFATSLATSTTYNLTAGSSSWIFAGLTSTNPTIFAAVGDQLTFNVAGGSSGTLFAVHRTAGSTDSSDRYPTSTSFAKSGSSLTITIGSDVVGATLFYEDESNPMTLIGDLCILLDNCIAMNRCGGPCVTCATGFGVTVGGTCGPLAAVQCPSPLPANCNSANCWNAMSGIEVQCTACAAGFWINSTQLCQACRTTCGVGNFISAPCGAFNDIVCSACTPCSQGQTLVTPCSGTGTTDNTICSGMGSPSPSPNPNPSPSPSPSSNCNPPPNCKTAECWSEDDVQCTECERGFFIDSTLQCSTCSNCSAGDYISWPCEGYTDTVCSACYSSACGPCQVGYTLDLYGLCAPQLCMLYGCGAANLDVICKEYSSSQFLCVCPGELVSYVTANVTTFTQCSSGVSQPAPINKILASVNTTNLEAFLINGMEQIQGAAIVTVSGNTFTLNINATVPIDGLTTELESEIAAFLGGGYTASDVSVTYVAKRKRANSGEVTVSVNGQSSAGTVFVPITSILIGLLTIVTLR